MAMALEMVIHAWLASDRPGYRFAVRIVPERLWSFAGPKVQVESFGPEVDHSIMDDLKNLLGVSKHLATSNL